MHLKNGVRVVFLGLVLLRRQSSVSQQRLLGIAGAIESGKYKSYERSAQMNLKPSDKTRVLHPSRRLHLL